MIQKQKDKTKQLDRKTIHTNIILCDLRIVELKERLRINQDMQLAVELQRKQICLDLHQEKEARDLLYKMLGE